MTTAVLLEWVIKSALILFVLVTAVAYLTFLERKVMSWIQLRVGPNRVGWWGLLQPLADGVKMIFKEDIIPTEANKWLYVAAPALSLIPALMTFIVIPYGSTVHVPFLNRDVALHVTNMNIGLLYIFALTSLGVYGLVLAGWASNNKYSLLGGLRSSAQMISYELAFGISIVSVLLYTGTLDLTEIVGKRLQQAPPADAVRADAQLYPAHHLALKERQVGDGSDQNEEDERRLDYPLKQNG